MTCEKCGKSLTGNQKRWCGLRCSKLGLKSLYKKRKKIQILAYNRKYRSLGKRPLKVNRKKELIDVMGRKCCRCGSVDNINIHHHKPLRFGGTNERNNLALFCFLCHMQLEKRMKGFWNV